MKRWILVILIALALAVVVVIVGVNQIRLDALQEPGRVETFLATVVKQFLVSRSSREGIPPPLSDLQESIAEGDKPPIAQCVMAPTAIHYLTPVGGCIRAPQILHRLWCNATPIAICSGL